MICFIPTVLKSFRGPTFKEKPAKKRDFLRKASDFSQRIGNAGERQPILLTKRYRAVHRVSRLFDAAHVSYR
jgi:hypothetical protein